MGGRSSKEGSWRQDSRSSSSSWGGGGGGYSASSYGQDSRSYSTQQSTSWSGYSSWPYGEDSQGYSTQQSYAPQPSQYSYAPPPAQYSHPPPQDHGGVAGKKRLDRRYSRIADNYNSLEQVKQGYITSSFSLFFVGLFGRKSPRH